MSLIINIDTALDIASVCLAKEEIVLQISFNENKTDHASWLHKAMADLLEKNSYSITDLQAVAVSIGPGSYTGLRVGLSAAKGLCYALNIPLIAVSTLEIIAAAVKDEATDLICPAIDARRMEIFTALYDKNLCGIISPKSVVITETTFESQLLSHQILFCGNGINKLQAVISNRNASFSKKKSDASHLAELSLARFRKKEFNDLAYTEPLYIKEFYSLPRKSG